MKKTTIIIVMAVLCLSFEANAQLFTGRVVDVKDQAPLAGAIIKVQGQQQTALSNDDGYFELNLPSGKHVLHVQYLSYAAKEVVITLPLKAPLLIELTATENVLKEVEINAGYYTIKERERTGSISKVSAETIGKQPISNPLMALQGTVAGVVVTQTTGMPGGGFEVQVRGRNSISSGSNPLYIIDGVTYPSNEISSGSSTVIYSTSGANPLSLINPDDIESIEILRDADATAIYGSRGANGVILITTKRGSSGDLKIDAKITQGFSKVAHRVDLLNTAQYLQMRKEAFANDGLTPSLTDYDVNGTWDQNKYTDWQEELIGGTANTTNAALSLSGGNEKSNYLIGGNYYKEGTVFLGDLSYKRTNLNASLNIGSPSDRFSVNFKANYGHIESNLTNYDFTALIYLSPNMPDMLNEFGGLNWSNNEIYVNPMSYLNLINESSTDNLLGNVALSYKILKGLTFKASLGYNAIKRTELIVKPLSAYAPAFGLTAQNRTSEFVNNFNNSWIVEPQLTYKSKIGPGVFDSLLGFSFQENTGDYRTIRGTNFSSDELMRSISSAAMLTPLTFNSSAYKYTAIFARLNYSISNRYFLNVTARRDGSTRFSTANQFANFGAIGAAWVFSDESIIRENFPFLSFGKIRASYGVTGNDQIGNYGYLQLWSAGNTYQGNGTVSPNRIANPNYGWETNWKAELALQLAFLKDRLNFELSFYKNNSSNQLIGLTLPSSTGFQSIQANLPGEVQNTGWEIATNFKILDLKDWKWQVGFNLTVPKNKLKAYPGLESSTNAFVYEIGMPLNIRKNYNVSVNPETGLYVFEDKDGNGSRNNADRYLNGFIDPKYYGGLQNSISFKQMKLSLLFAFTKQDGVNYLDGPALSPGRWTPSSPYGNQLTEVLNRWQKPGDETSLQRFGTTTATNSPFTDLKLRSIKSFSDASFIRLKNIFFSYGLPKEWAAKMKIANAEISFQGQNIFTWTNYIGLDPETQSMSNLPPLRTLTMGLKLTL